MEDESKIQGFAKWGLGTLGLSAVAAYFLIRGTTGLVIALTILVLALLLFGAYYLWHRRRARRNREQFTSAIESQAAAAPRGISDPKKRADLDKVREKFQTGLQEFKSRGKDIYKLPWYVIIGESGSGKTEAIRHSEIDFPPGLNKEHQGSGGTVNMDWWFTNRGVILDTAGSMLFPEAGAGDNNQQWQEFLRLLKKARPDCPVNGLFLVLSIESIIKDSADRISQKASRLAQQLDLIQRTLDVRFPVYLLITKCDLLTGFREFFDSIEDPLLQHQIFGWSNPDPLDAPFRPDLVEQHLGSIAARVRRRRLALLRDTSAAGRIGDTQHFFASTYQLGRGMAQTRRLDEVDSMFAFPESIMRLAPRLRRYLETIFVAGEWSAKPVFLRGIFFTSSMREGRALDEAMALAANLSLDQLPEDRTWERNRAYFLRDLFHEKVFRESGLVTRATNTLKLLRHRQLAIFGSAGVALLILLVFAGFAFYNLKKSVLAEAANWQIGATNLTRNGWSTPIVAQGESFHFVYNATNRVPGSDTNLIQYQRQLQQTIQKPLRVSWIFWPLQLFNLRDVKDRPMAQRVLFEASVLGPLVKQTRAKLTMAAPADSAGLARHKDALLSLMDLEADARGVLPRIIDDTNSAARWLSNLQSYLTDADVKADPALAEVFAWTYSPKSLRENDGKWPPASALGDAELTKNTAIEAGLMSFHNASMKAQTNILQQLKLADNVTDKLFSYYKEEVRWLTNSSDLCSDLSGALGSRETEAESALRALQSASNAPVGALNSLMARYRDLGGSASNASAKVLDAPVNRILLRLPQSQKDGLFAAIKTKLDQLAGKAADTVFDSLSPRREAVALVDANCLAISTNPAPAGNVPAFQARWALYTSACELKKAEAKPQDDDIGSNWNRFGKLREAADQFRNRLAAYRGPLAGAASNTCDSIAADAERNLKSDFVNNYVSMVSLKLSSISSQTHWSPTEITNARVFFTRVEADLNGSGALAQEQGKVEPLRKALSDSKKATLAAINNDLVKKFGFPVSLKSKQEVGLQELGDLRKLLATVSSEVALPIWKTDNATALEGVLKSCDEYLPIVNMLVSDNGDPTEWELSFIAPEAQNDRAIAFAYRILEATIKDKTGMEPELSKYNKPGQPVRLVAGKAQQPLTLKFQKSSTDANPMEIPVKNWWVASMMRLYADDPSEVNGAWRFKLPLRHPEQTNLVGHILFEARPVNSKLPLPKFANWAR